MMAYINRIILAFELLGFKQSYLPKLAMEDIITIEQFMLNTMSKKKINVSR